MTVLEVVRPLPSWKSAAQLVRINRQKFCCEAGNGQKTTTFAIRSVLYGVAAMYPANKQCQVLGVFEK